jgi:hypothetical protein
MKGNGKQREDIWFGKQKKKNKFMMIFSYHSVCCLFYGVYLCCSSLVGGTGQVAELTDGQVLLAALPGLPGRDARLVVLHQHATARLSLPAPALHRYVCVKSIADYHDINAR